jgi:sugar diacid utilization regulator
VRPYYSCVATKSGPKARAKKPITGERPADDVGRSPAPGPSGGLEALSEAIESGAGLPAVARAAAAALDASVALIDRSSAVLAVAAKSSAEEEKLIAAEGGVETTELRVADAIVGELRFRAGSKAGLPASTVRMVATLLGLEVERARAPDWASDEAAHDFAQALLDGRLSDPDDIDARAGELGTDLRAGAGVIRVRAHPNAAQPGEWRERMLMLTLRTVRARGRGAIAFAAHGEGGEAGEVAAIAPTDSADEIGRAAAELQSELSSALQGFDLVVGFSRHAEHVEDIYRAGKEALLAVNVGEAEGYSPLAFEETGSYRLLLPALSQDPAELERFYDETVAPLAAYDDQYETELVTTIEAYLENDGNVTPTAESLFTHRHTVRYRLERVKELSGHDMTSTKGREKIGLGLKAMRVLGVPAPRGPAMEDKEKPSNGKRSTG